MHKKLDSIRPTQGGCDEKANILQPTERAERPQAMVKLSKQNFDLLEGNIESMKKNTDSGQYKRKKG